ncbi:MAG TPA: RluA family pseudouridine synthase, partial [Campylobacterales bacterium]|nr:RluA family pseudouridine synthase [Campylobacterales bacterium]
HGGNHGDYGVIEILRESRKELPYLELVHRLDRETSGVLLISKSRPILQELHHLLREGHQMEKHYVALVHGIWKQGKQTLTHQLQRQANRTQKVQVSAQGKASTSIFTPLQHFDASTLMDVQIITGRMHQIRTQLAYLNHPIIGDTMYGDQKVNKRFQKEYQHSRLFLHARHINFRLDGIQKSYALKAPLPPMLIQLVEQLSAH